MNQKIRLASQEMPYSINEDIKILRTNLQFLGADKKILLFTSSIGGEGKSAVSYELARSLTDIEKKVLYVDCDLRKSSTQQRITGKRNTANIDYGMSHYLSSQCEITDVVYPTSKQGLDVILAGPFPPNPSELLSHPRMGMLLRQLREAYDYIIIDSAPVGLVTDASVIAPHCDGIILLMESEKIAFRMAQTVTKRLQATNTPILGVVLNKVQSSKNPYYHHYYSKEKPKGLKRLFMK